LILSAHAVVERETEKAVADILYNRATRDRVNDLIYLINSHPRAAAAARLAARKYSAAMIDGIAPRAAEVTGSSPQASERPRDVWVSSSRNIP
jgi:hypothetical protein